MPENKLFPGRPGYTGPTSGVFAMLHHTVLAERSHDVMERVDYVRRCKPKREIKVRLRNMMYLGAAGERYLAKLALLWADYAAKLDALWAAYKAKRAPLEADYAAKIGALDAELLAYIGEYMPGHAWNGRKIVGTAD